ncbi:hypothetical protein GYMLUDRAFT_935881 [Collybiopsis luxurians FD-317 M1]|uniref:Uncharacterized protein n=1 Tax=Collybiopsis luxurians FD-317 M1 TaxID=944289 RepID=A0A0D0BFV4_9AGAR|nr:hypothetical protein GYMLUDRAFT_935881 [Collybiopsis luxurians FD-317 M1]
MRFWQARHRLAVRSNRDSLQLCSFLDRTAKIWYYDVQVCRALLWLITVVSIPCRICTGLELNLLLLRKVG